MYVFLFNRTIIQVFCYIPYRCSVSLFIYLFIYRANHLYIARLARFNNSLMIVPLCRNIKSVYISHIAYSILENLMLANVLFERKFSHLIYKTKIHTLNSKMIASASQEAF
jgi:hypothetical protein